MIDSSLDSVPLIKQFLYDITLWMFWRVLNTCKNLVQVVASFTLWKLDAFVPCNLLFLFFFPAAFSESLLLRLPEFLLFLFCLAEFLPFLPLSNELVRLLSSNMGEKPVRFLEAPRVFPQQESGLSQAWQLFPLHASSCLSHPPTHLWSLSLSLADLSSPASSGGPSRASGASAPIVSSVAAHSSSLVCHSFSTQIVSSVACSSLRCSCLSALIHLWGTSVL